MLAGHRCCLALSQFWESLALQKQWIRSPAASSSCEDITGEKPNFMICICAGEPLSFRERPGSHIGTVILGLLTQCVGLETNFFLHSFRMVRML